MCVCVCEGGGGLLESLLLVGGGGVLGVGGGGRVSLWVCGGVGGGGVSSPKFVAYDTLTLSQTRQSRSHVDDLRGHQIGKESCEVTSLGWWGPLWANTFLTRTPFFLR